MKKNEKLERKIAEGKKIISDLKRRVAELELSSS